MPDNPTSQEWPADRAILLVHGVGNAKPGDYAQLVATLEGALGRAAGDFAIYELSYNVINNWHEELKRLVPTR